MATGKYLGGVIVADFTGTLLKVILKKTGVCTSSLFTDN